ncbi:pentapeptide repeat-containing protein [Rothia mucilaginosa]|uniref:pentapeptide repeat-containing protein n=1 Tax=Rothia mucilaginosa TaxID=43675 RepID=UPI0028DC08B4|nr:pentapeptide repeat-containing protein [Rothia mucilaginosa]
MSEQDTSLKSTDSSEPIPSEIPTNSQITGKQDSHRALTLTLLIAIPAISWIIYLVFFREWNSSQSFHWFPFSILLTIISATISILWIKKPFRIKISTFTSWIFSIAIIGGSIAFLLPLAITNDFAKDGEGTTLRQIIIYATGGFLGVITLSETRRKNDIEKSKFDEQNNQFIKQLEAQRKNLVDQLNSQENNLKKQLNSQLKSQREQLAAQNEKDERDHIRQVHAERRARYAKAIEQLAHDKSVIRLGGVYTLVGLVDEWLLDDTSLVDSNNGEKEGQIIINNLCAYIRSPFPLAEKRENIEASVNPDIYEGDLSSDKVRLREEQEIRQSIFSEMSKRLSTAEEAGKYDCSIDTHDIEITKGPWSNFSFSFSGSQLFYSLASMSFENADFENITCYGDTNFSNSHFYTYTDFSKSTFYGNSDFSRTHFIDAADFSKSTFHGDLTFEYSKFSSDLFEHINFSSSIFKGEANFDYVKTTGLLHFSHAKFYGPAYFIEANVTTLTTYNNLWENNLDEDTATHSDFIHVPFFAAKFNKQYKHTFEFELEEDYVHPLHSVWVDENQWAHIPIGSSLFQPES